MLSERREGKLTAKSVPKGFPKVLWIEGMDGLELLREHPKLNTKSVCRSRLHKAVNDLCGGIGELLRVDEDRKVVCHAPCFRPEQFFGAFVSFHYDFGLLAPLRLWPRRFQKKGIP